MDALAVRYWDGDSDGNYTDAHEIHFPLHDANMNVAALVNSSGTVIERYHYSPYGELTVLDNIWTVDSDQVSDFENPYACTGRRFDGETEIYQYRHRYYHAQLGRFVTRDPIR